MAKLQFFSKGLGKIQRKIIFLCFSLHNSKIYFYFCSVVSEKGITKTLWVEKGVSTFYSCA